MDNLSNGFDGSGEPRRSHYGSYERYKAENARRGRNSTQVFCDGRVRVLGRGGVSWHAASLLEAAGSLQEAIDALRAALRVRRAGR